MWNTISIEGFCFADQQYDKYPCGQTAPSHFCLGIHTGACPHFAFSNTTERDAAIFVPLRLLIWDRIKIWCRDIYDTLHWWFWGSLWFNRIKVDEFFRNIKVVSAEDSEVVSNWENNLNEAYKKFPMWFAETKAQLKENENDCTL
jgi:hypothetical protein